MSTIKSYDDDKSILFGSGNERFDRIVTFSIIMHLQDLTGQFICYESRCFAKYRVHCQTTHPLARVDCAHDQSIFGSPRVRKTDKKQPDWQNS